MRLSSLFSLLSIFLLCFTVADIKAQHGHSQDIRSILANHQKGKLNSNTAYQQLVDVFEDGSLHKCATPLTAFYSKHKSGISEPAPFSMDQKRRSPTKVYITPSDKFEISYDTTGVNAVPLADDDFSGVPDYVEAVGEAADSSYRHLVQRLGYADPIPIGFRYEVSFRDLGFYGFTARSNNPVGPSTYIVLENDFVGFPDNDDPDGIQAGAIKVTMAHEFKHAIQYVQNNWNGDSDRWAEMDATLVEETVYDPVNDYYNYLDGFGSTIFSNSAVTIAPGSYEDVTWALYFEEKYGTDFWPAAWNRIETSLFEVPLLTAVEQELESRSLSYNQSLSELYLWHIAAGANSVPSFGFDERLAYPEARIRSRLTQLNDTLSSANSLGSLSAHFYEIDLADERNGDVVIQTTYTMPNIETAFIVYLNNGTSTQFIGEANESGTTTFTTSIPWKEVESIFVSITNSHAEQDIAYRYRFTSDIPKEIGLAQNYPNPFNPSTTIPVDIPRDQKVRLSIYDYTGRLIAVLLDGNIEAGAYQIPFDAYNLASGVYLYRLVTEEGTLYNKMTLIK